MKVILLRDVAKIGKRFSIVEVPDGFALNKLIPSKDAEPASPANVKRVLEKHKQTAAGALLQVNGIKGIHETFATDPLLILMEANAQGHLFQSVHVSDIVKAAKEKGVVIPEGVVKIEAPIKSVGTHEVKLEVPGNSYSLSLSVVPKK